MRSCFCVIAVEAACGGAHATFEHSNACCDTIDVFATTDAPVSSELAVITLIIDAVLDCTTGVPEVTDVAVNEWTCVNVSDAIEGVPETMLVTVIDTSLTTPSSAIGADATGANPNI